MSEIVDVNIVSGGGGGGDASAANQLLEIGLLEDIKANTADIQINADSINLNTDNLETLIAEAHAIAGSDAAKAVSVQGITGGKSIPVTGTFWQDTQPISNADLTAINTNTNNGLYLLFNNIANAPVTASDVSAWNTYFSTDIFTSATVSGNSVTLKGVGTFVLTTDRFKNSTSLVKFLDNSGYVQAALNYCFSGATVLTDIYLPEMKTGGYSFCDNSAVVRALIGKCTSLGDGSFNSCEALKTFDFDSLFSVGSSFLMDSSGLETPTFPSLTVAGDSLLQSTGAWEITLPELVTTKNSAFYNVVADIINAPKWLTSGTNVFQNATITKLFIPEFSAAGSSAFSGMNPATTIYLNRRFATQNADYLAFKTGSTTEVIVDNDVVEKIYTTGDLTSTATTSAAMACKGAETFELVLKLGTATTAATLQMQGTNDETNWYDLGISLTGVASTTQQVSAGGACPSSIRWKVSGAGNTIGAGWSVTLRAK